LQRRASSLGRLELPGTDRMQAYAAVSRGGRHRRLLL